MNNTAPTSIEADGWLLMVRHTDVHDNLRGVCYGASDVELSPEGIAHIETLKLDLAVLQPTHVVHSGLSRTRQLAEAVALKLNLQPNYDPRITEFNFGEWELRRWEEIHAEGHDIARLIHEPATFSGPGGETLHAMRDRVLAWYGELPKHARILAVSHGGPISVLVGTLADAPPHAWPTLVPACGEHIRIDLPR